jgi:Domain of unknown function (DUF5667)
MTRLFPVPVPGQRAAEEFDSVLGGRATQDVAERYGELVATVQVLSDQPLITPRAEFAADLRSRLMLAAETDLVPAPPVVRRAPASRSQRNRRLGSAAAALVIVGGSAGMAAAASGALPGQSLYPIKRGIEQVTTAAHVGNASKGSALLGQAGQRLDEVDGLLSAGSPNAGLVESTVDSFSDQANAGADKLFTAYQTNADPTDISTVRDFTSASMSQIASMASSANPGTLGSLRDAADTLADIDQQAATLCASCGGGSVLTPPGALASGAGAATVNHLIARPVTQATADADRATLAQQADTKQQIGGLQSAAQGAATKLGKGGGASTGTDPLTSTVTGNGKLVPGVTSTAGTAVKSLVGGLTTTVKGGGGGGGHSGLDGVAGGAGAAVGKTVDGVTDGLKGTVDGLTGSLLPDK